MRIFYYFQDLETNMFDWQRVHIINELEHHGVYVETFNPLYYNSTEEANETALKKIKESHYDLFFTNVCYHKMLYPETVESIKSMGIPTLCIRCDNLIIPYNDKVLSPYFDLVWLTSIETKNLYDSWGVNSFFAPYAANPFVFSYVSNKIIRRPCFIGTPYGSRSIMINSLTKARIDVDVFYGGKGGNHQAGNTNLKSEIIQQSRASIVLNRLRFKEGRVLLKGLLVNRFAGQHSIDQNSYLHHNDSLSFDDMIKSYSEYALSLSSTSTRDTDVLSNPLKVINLRNFEIPMCGGIEICKYNKELADYFEDGKEIIFYQTNDELIDKARYFIDKASDTELFEMKTAARKRAENEHTWWARFMIAFDLLGLKYKTC